MSRKRRERTPLEKKARRGFRGYPVATVAYYGPDDKRATKVAVGIVTGENEEDVITVERWVSENRDVRFDHSLHTEILAFIRKHQVRSVVITDGIIGCPHEEGIDYPDGENCPQCPFWANRDRWTGEMIH